jgi:hypothetical protein
MRALHIRNSIRTMIRQLLTLRLPHFHLLHHENTKGSCEPVPSAPDGTPVTFML